MAPHKCNAWMRRNRGIVREINIISTFFSTYHSYFNFFSSSTGNWRKGGRSERNAVYVCSVCACTFTGEIGVYWCRFIYVMAGAGESRVVKSWTCGVF